MITVSPPSSPSRSSLLPHFSKSRVSLSKQTRKKKKEKKKKKTSKQCTRNAETYTSKTIKTQNQKPYYSSKRPIRLRNAIWDKKNPPIISEFFLCCPSTDNGACLYVLFVYSMKWETNFSFESSCQVEITSGLGMEAYAYFPILALGLHLFWTCTWCHRCCEFVCSRPAV